MKRFLLMLIALLSLMFGLFPSEQVGAQSSQLTALDVIAEVNSLRSADGLIPYQVDPILMDIAQTHADRIASTGVVTRFDTGGFSPYQRAIKAGYSVAGDLSIGGLFFESLHSGAGESSADVINAWKASSDDLNALLSTDFKDIGVGLAVANGLTYYVLDVGTSTGEKPIVAANTTGTQSAPVITSTPLENGEVYHIVQSKEALWSIALAYNTTIEQLKFLNGLATDEIFIGQKLLVIKPEPPTATPSPMVTATFGIPTATSTRPVIPTVTSTSTPVPTPPKSPQSAESAVGIIVLVALIASGLVAWLSRKKS
jgi:LysM repeat protein